MGHQPKEKWPFKKQNPPKGPGSLPPLVRTADQWDMGGSSLDQRREIAFALLGRVHAGEHMVTTLGETVVVLGAFDHCTWRGVPISYTVLTVPPVPWEKPYEKIVPIEVLIGRAER